MAAEMNETAPTFRGHFVQDLQIRLISPSCILRPRFAIFHMPNVPRRPARDYLEKLHAIQQPSQPPPCQAQDRKETRARHEGGGFLLVTEPSNPQTWLCKPKKAMQSFQNSGPKSLKSLLCAIYPSLPPVHPPGPQRQTGNAKSGHLGSQHCQPSRPTNKSSENRKHQRRSPSWSHVRVTQVSVHPATESRDQGCRAGLAKKDRNGDTTEHAHVDTVPPARFMKQAEASHQWAPFLCWSPPSGTYRLRLIQSTVAIAHWHHRDIHGMSVQKKHLHSPSGLCHVWLINSKANRWFHQSKQYVVKGAPTGRVVHDTSTCDISACERRGCHRHPILKYPSA